MKKKPGEYERHPSNTKHDIFVREYLKDKNATRAAVAAGYSEHTAEVAGSRLLKHVNVKKRIDQALSRQMERMDLKADDVLRELIALSFVDMSEAYDETGNLKPLSEIPKNIRKCINNIEVSEIYDYVDGVKTAVGKLKKVKFIDKTKPIEMLAKHFKLLTEVREVVGNAEKPVEIKVNSDQVKGILDQLKNEF